MHSVGQTIIIDDDDDDNDNEFDDEFVLLLDISFHCRFSVPTGLH